MRIGIFVLFLGVAIKAHSQEHLNKISVNPIQLFGYNRLNIEYERGFNDGKTGISFYMGRTGEATRKIHGQYSYLSEQNVSVKFYTKSIDKPSFWYGGVISVSSGNIYDSNKRDSALNIGALGIMGGSGYQFVKKSFYLNVYVNFGYAVTNDLFGTARYVGNIGKPTDFLLMYGFKTGICF